MQLSLYEAGEAPPPAANAAMSGAFTDNMKLPVHRWFRYSAGFSAQWVERLVREHSGRGAPRILDPFCGSGTTLVAAAAAGAGSVGLETHPFVARIAAAKLGWAVDPDAFEAAAALVAQRARAAARDTPRTTSALLLKCYDPERLAALEALRDAYLAEVAGKAPHAAGELVWLAITCILRECSGVGTAQWQYVLPNKSKARVSDPHAAFRARIAMFRNDLVHASAFRGAATVLRHDARVPLAGESFDLVVTSPPYPNNYDYADATRLEMTFWEEISSWGDLQGSVRRHLVRSCSQHSAAERLELDELLADEALGPIAPDIAAVCRELEQVRLGKGGRKTYHTMIAAYFGDLARAWRALRPVLREGGRAAFVIGDSAPYGVHVPCEEWLGRLALAAGFRSFSFDKIRDRNVKWKNRKHTVPLKEGVLWVEA